MQPSLGMRNHGNRVGGSADHEPGIFQSFDERLDLGFFRHHVFDIAANREPYVPIGKFITDVTQLAKGKHIQNTLGAGLDRPNFIAAVGNMAQNTWPG